MSAFDPCPKPNCPGVIGSDRTCSVCGASELDGPAPDDDLEVDDTGEPTAPDDPASETDEGDDDFGGEEDDEGDNEEDDEGEEGDDEEDDEGDDEEDDEGDDEEGEEWDEEDEDAEDPWDQDEDDEEDLYDEDRVPCSDGACIGVIGPDGRCTECGLAGEDPAPGDEDEDEDWAEDEDEEAEIGATDAAEDDERIPCPDGTCIGIIGPDGRCCECGRTSD